MTWGCCAAASIAVAIVPLGRRRPEDPRDPRLRSQPAPRSVLNYLLSGDEGPTEPRREVGPGLRATGREPRTTLVTVAAAVGDRGCDLRCVNDEHVRWARPRSCLGGTGGLWRASRCGRSSRRLLGLRRSMRAGRTGTAAATDPQVRPGARALCGRPLAHHGSVGSGMHAYCMPHQLDGWAARCRPAIFESQWSIR